jgi:hypothetical protein
VRLLPAGLALLAGVLGCSRTLNYTAGVCDCNPPDVTSVFAAPPRGYSMIGAAHAPAPGVKILPSINGVPQGTDAPPVNMPGPVNSPSVNKLPSAEVSPSGQAFAPDAPKLVPVPANPAAPETTLDVAPDAAPKESKPK